MQVASSDGTLSFVQVEPTNDIQLLQNNDILHQKLTTSQSSLSTTSSRKRRADFSESSSSRKRKCLADVNPQFQLLDIDESTSNAPLLTPLLFPDKMDNQQAIMQIIPSHDDNVDNGYKVDHTLSIANGPGPQAQEQLQKTQLHYQQDLCNWLNEMRKTETSCDVKFLTREDILVAAHSYIVRKVPYFAEILDKQLQGCPQANVPNGNCKLFITVDASAELMQCILDFVYTGTCKIVRSNVLMLLDQAARIDFEELTKTCIELIKMWGMVTPNNCLTIIQLIEAHPESDSCQVLKDYVLGLWEKDYLEHVLLSKNLKKVLDLSNDVFQQLLFRSVHYLDDQTSCNSELFQCAKLWFSKYQEDLLGELSAGEQKHLRFLNTLSHRLHDETEEECKFEINVPASEINDYKCQMSCHGVDFEIKFNVVEDVDGHKWLRLVIDYKKEKLAPTWYRVVGFGYTIVSEDCVFACTGKKSVFFEEDFRRKQGAAIRRVMRMDQLLDPCNSYLTSNGELRFVIRIEPDHISSYFVHYVINNFQSIWEEEQESILSLGIGLMTFILQQDMLNVDNEGLVLRIICLWLTDEYLDVELFNESDITELLACVRWNFTTFKHIEKAFALIHNASNGMVLNHFHQCAQKLSCSNDKPRESYKDRSTNFQAWKSLFQSDCIVSSISIRYMLDFMLNLSKSSNSLSRSEIELRMSQEVHLSSSKMREACVDFVEEIMKTKGKEQKAGSREAGD